MKSFSFLRPQELILIGVTILWGGTFLIIKQAVHQSGPLFFVGFRFFVAAVIVAIVFHKALKGLSKKEIIGGTTIGLSIYLGYGLQTMGLESINSSQSAFITALYVPFVPLLQWGVLKRRPSLGSWIGAALCFIGLILIKDPQNIGFSFSFGEIITIIAAFFIAIEIILIGKFAPEVDSRRLTLVQLIVASIAAFVTMPILGEPIPQFSPIWFWAAVALGTMTALIQLAMNWAQKSVSPTKATIIYAGEPIWAGLFGRMAGERFGPFALLGAALIIAGILISQLLPTSLRNKLSASSNDKSKDNSSNS